ncbi:hypothetical protein [Pelagerythrobacter marinus]|uniref:hypothetical protein n=1 Tax=Pelagerythrobacter marinus TaxID=538382 RepID=UPI002036942D|nr:hypothetical protein [Pelagerythrobacter marinus]USA38316.1 hypothetical protein NCF86_08165 [Pelagerythrobacter marinus]WPZ07722.1 hypothetical protein T8T98_04185 [Pelagerythrobacter marinus]
MRGRLRGAFGLGGDVDVVFAPSGTDLEYVALAATIDRSPGGVHNVLLGADEVGRGCVHSAAGRYFNDRTAPGRTVVPGESVPGLGAVSLTDIPVRCGRGLARTSGQIAASIEGEIARARAGGRHTLVHVVHGSKTGLILPALDDLDRLLARWGQAMTPVVDACQVRLSPGDVAAYLDRGAIVLMTGSKFAGGVPFSGWALVPADLVRRAPPLPAGFDALFRRAEWPQGWNGREALPDQGNPGLATRLEGALFELERFRALPVDAVSRVIDAFQRALRQGLVAPLHLREVERSADPDPDPDTDTDTDPDPDPDTDTDTDPDPDPDTDTDTGQPAAPHADLLATLATLDVSALPAARSFDGAVSLHARLARGGIRLGQPVRSVRLPCGGWGGTLRLGLSMPQIAALAPLSQSACEAAFAAHFELVAEALRQCEAVA